jgi:hypothetical protein
MTILSNREYRGQKISKLFNFINIQFISTKLGRNDSNMMFLMKKIVIFIFYGKKRKFRFFRRKNPEFREKDGNLFFISRKLSGTPYCAQIYLKSLKKQA